MGLNHWNDLDGHNVFALGKQPVPLANSTMIRHGKRSAD